MLRFPTEGYRDLKEDCPDIPADTCPLIDKTLKHVTEIEVNLDGSNVGNIDGMSEG